MIESAARAERFEPQAPAPPFYLWEVSQKPVCVKLPFPLIDRLEHEVVETFRSLSARGSEIGGLLLGKISAGNPAVVSIEDFELIECDYTRGPLYRLSDADTDRFERAVAQHGAAGLPVAGFFRSHTRKALSLDPEDIALLDLRFASPQQIALLIRPFATKPSMAGIFIRENGKINGEASYQEFPFRSSQLTASTKQPETAAEAAPASAPAAPPAPAAQKGGARAQIVPIAPRRESPAPTPEPTPEAKPADKPAPAASAPAAAEPAPAPAAKAVEEPKAAIETPVKSRPEPAKPEPAPAVEPAEPEPAAASGKFTKIAIAGAAALIILVLLFVYPGFLMNHGSNSAATTQDTSALALRVQHNGGEILLTWNRDSDAVRNATHAVLSISDGERHENVDLDLNTLHSGSINYTPATSDVVFRIEVTGKGQTKTMSESIRALQARPSPMPAEGEAGAQAQNSAAKTPAPAAQTPAPAPAPADTTAADATPPQEEATPKAPVRQFRAETLAQRLHPVASPTALPDAPTMGVQTNRPSSLSGLNLGTAAAPPPPPPSNAAPTGRVTPPSPARIVTGGNIVQAEPLRRKEPEYPKIARDAGARGAVELEAMIGTDGHVKSVKVLSGHAMLRKAASDAVMQWIYKPTLLNGTPVEAPVHVTINFQGR